MFFVSLFVFLFVFALYDTAQSSMFHKDVILKFLNLIDILLHTHCIWSQFPIVHLSWVHSLGNHAGCLPLVGQLGVELDSDWLVSYLCGVEPASVALVLGEPGEDGFDVGGVASEQSS